MVPQKQTIRNKNIERKDHEMNQEESALDNSRSNADAKAKKNKRMYSPLVNTN